MGATSPYPPGTGNDHFKAEFAVATGMPVVRVSVVQAMGVVFGYDAPGFANERPRHLGKDVRMSRTAPSLHQSRRLLSLVQWPTNAFG